MSTPVAAVLPPEGGPRLSVVRSHRRLLGLTVGLILIVGLTTVLRAGIAGPVQVSSSSMLPTLAKGDVVLVRRAGLSLGDLHHGDLVTFDSPDDGRPALKRVVGLPGDTVVIKDAVLYVQDQPVDEPYVDHQLIDAYYTPTYTVPSGTFFVMGDHRSNSTDSRDYGPVDADDLTGRVLVRLWPPARR